MEIFGRKTTVKVTSLPYIIGWVLISLSDNIYKLYAGRFISGVAVGKFELRFYVCTDNVHLTSLRKLCWLYGINLIMRDDFKTT
jgi:SP family facilitated glucose transporter-like MFS transporter 8